MHKPLFAALLIFAVAGLLGCPKRIDFGPEGPLSDAREVLARVDRAEAACSSMSAEGQLQFDVPEGKASVGAFVAATAPRSVLIQTNDFFGRPQSVLVSDGERFGLWVAQEGAYYVGPASRANLARFIRVELSSDEVAALLLGRAPRIDAAAWKLAVDRDAAAYVLRGSDGQRSQALWVDPSTFRPIRSEVVRPDGQGYRARFEDFMTSPMPFPRRVALQALAPKGPTAKLELNDHRPALNEAQDPAQFVPEPPEGVQVIELDERGAQVPPTRG